MTSAPAQGAAATTAASAPATLFVMSIVAALVVGGFLALGIWQLERLTWKLALIDRVEQRVRAPAVSAPPPEEWPGVSAPRDEYRHVRVTGSFLHESETLVQAVTAAGAGFWVLTPLRGADGSVVLVNRGFVPPERRERAAHGGSTPAATVTVTGLLRITEPGGGFLRRNDPAAQRWYSRDVQAIAAARGLERVAPFFIDADADADAGTEPATPAGRAETRPTAGLTTITFPNHHALYAATWFALALMSAGGALHVVREELAQRRHRAAGEPAAHG